MDKVSAAPSSWERAQRLYEKVLLSLSLNWTRDHMCKSLIICQMLRNLILVYSTVFSLYNVSACRSYSFGGRIQCWLSHLDVVGLGFINWCYSSSSNGNITTLCRAGLISLVCLCFGINDRPCYQYAVVYLLSRTVA